MNLKWLFMINMIWGAIMVLVCLIDKIVNNAPYTDFYAYLLLLNIWIVGYIIYGEIRRKR